MKRDALKRSEVRAELSKKNHFVVEKLDFSELATVKGGNKKPTDPAGNGHGGGLFCCM